MCMSLFWNDHSHFAEEEKKQDCEEKAALPLVAAVAAETPQRKWGIGHTLIQFTINKTLLDAGPYKHVALPYVALFMCAASLHEYVCVCDWGL